jgi:glyoxylase-like metal-dependent hydrolase (beta-lactamase superfamily II)
MARQAGAFLKHTRKNQMKYQLRTAAIAAIVLLPMTAMTAPADQVQAAIKALGANELHTLQFTAIGIRSQFSQGLWSDYPYLPVRTITNYQLSVDFDAGRLRTDVEAVPGPTAGYFSGSTRQIEALGDGFAWSEPTPVAGQGAHENVSAAAPQPDAVSERELWLWGSSPQGVLKAAANGTARAVEGGTELTFMIGKQPMTAYVNQMNQVERLETMMATPVLGDTPFVIRYAGYRDIGGIQFPAMISETLGGYPIFQLAVTGVQKNPAVSIAVPDKVRAFKAPVPTLKPQKVAEGVYLMAGYTHTSMAVDMGDYIAMVEAPLNETVSAAIIAETKRLIPGKPIRFVINTHVHFDHSGGLRTYVAEGATVITHPANRAFYEKAWALPRTIEPDRLAKSGKHAKFMDVADHGAIKGKNGRVIELYRMQGNPHNEEMLIAWLPTERIAFHSDLISGGNLGLEGHPNPSVTNFYDNLQRLKIQPLKFVSGHGATVQTMADLTAAAGHANDR